MKQKIIISSLIAVSAWLLLLTSCKNEVEIFAPENDVTLVYGLLNADDTLHRVKINRVFRGDKAIKELANDPSIIEYDNLEVRVLELEIQNRDTVETGRSWKLEETTVIDKDSGYFYYPNQKMYQFSAMLSPNKFYKLEVDKLNESPIVYSVTPLLNKREQTLLKPIGLNFIGLGLASNEGLIDEVRLEMSVPVNGKVIEVYLDFVWRDEYLDGTLSDYQTVSYKVGTFVSSAVPLSASQSVSVFGSITPRAFFEYLAAKIPVVEQGSNIKQRVPGMKETDWMPLKFRFVMGGEELNTYMEVASPSTSLLEEKPDYSNVMNGIGLFSCRTFDELNSKMSPYTWNYLVDGEIMAGRNFCHNSSTDPKSCY